MRTSAAIFSILISPAAVACGGESSSADDQASAGSETAEEKLSLRELELPSGKIVGDLPRLIPILNEEWDTCTVDGKVVTSGTEQCIAQRMWHQYCQVVEEAYEVFAYTECTNDMNYLVSAALSGAYQG